MPELVYLWGRRMWATCDPSLLDSCFKFCPLLRATDLSELDGLRLGKVMFEIPSITTVLDRLWTFGVLQYDHCILHYKAKQERSWKCGILKCRFVSETPEYLKFILAGVKSIQTQRIIKAFASPHHGRPHTESECELERKCPRDASNEALNERLDFQSVLSP